MLYLRGISDVYNKVIVSNFPFIQINFVVLTSIKYILNKPDIFTAVARIVQ